MRRDWPEKAKRSVEGRYRHTSTTTAKLERRIGLSKITYLKTTDQVDRWGRRREPSAFFAFGEERISAFPPYNHPTFALLLPYIHVLSETGFVSRENRGAKQLTSEILKRAVDSPESGAAAKWPKWRYRPLSEESCKHRPRRVLRARDSFSPFLFNPVRLVRRRVCHRYRLRLHFGISASGSVGTPAITFGGGARIYLGPAMGRVG